MSVYLQADHIDKSYFNRIEKERGIPTNLLYAMALQESGVTRKGRFVVWPWSLNVGGKSLYFDTRVEAYETLKQELDNGRVHQLGIGVGQLEWQYHSHRFESLWDSLDPAKNIKAQADYYLELKSKTKTWIGALGLYHVGNIRSEKRVEWAINYIDKVIKRHEKI